VEELREKYPEVEVQFSTECSLLGMAMVFGDWKFSIDWRV
jgi:hypothetical protein